MEQLAEAYETRLPLLTAAAGRIERDLQSHFRGFARVDRISCRAKSADSFVGKVERRAAEGTPYAEPLREVEDQIGGRIIVFFLSDVARAVARAEENFASPVESGARAPVNEAEFGYEGFHSVYAIPGTAFPADWPEHGDVPTMFELQVRTLFQHAWAEPQHDVGYKPEKPLSGEQKRLLAWVAASAWGADQAFERLWKSVAD